MALDARLTRDGVVYATGIATDGRLVVRVRRLLRAGGYTLTLTRRTNRRRVVSSQQLTLA